MCHNWFSHFISKLQDSNLRFWHWLGWIFLDFRWMKAVLTREVSIGFSSRFYLFFPRRSHSFALGRTQSTATTRSHGKFEGVIPCVKETLSNSMIGTPKGWKDCMKKIHYILGGCFNYVSITDFLCLPYFEKIFNLKLLKGVEATSLQTRYIFHIFSVNLSCRVMFDLKAHTVPNLPHSPRAQLMLDACSVLEAHGELHIVFWQMAEIHPDLDGASRELKGWGYDEREKFNH